MKRDTRPIIRISEATAIVFGPRLHAELRRGLAVDVAGVRLRLRVGAEPAQLKLEVS